MSTTDPASAGPAGKKAGKAGAKLPVVGGAPAPAAGKGGKKAAAARAGGWAAFTDGGAAPRWIVAARLVLVLALAATVPTILGVSHGRRLLWTVGIAALPFFWIIAGYHVWRRICPLAVVGQLGRLLGRPGTRKAGDWLGRHYLLIQLGGMFVGMSYRLVVGNGSTTWLAGFLVAAVVAAAVTSFVYAGKTWCNFLCPVGLVEKIYTEPVRAAPAPVAQAELTSQCGPCVACKRHCPDIDQEQGYWKELTEPGRRIAYFAWPGMVVAFYLYYYLVSGTWDYYFSGVWAYEDTQATTWLDAGFTFWPAVPRVVAAPLTVGGLGLASYLGFAGIEAVLRRRVERGLAGADDGADDAARTGKVAAGLALVRHRLLIVAGFVGFNAFYLFAGQPSLRRLPEWVVHGWGLVVVFASAAIFFRRWGRSEDAYVEEKFAQKILKKWEWGDAPPSDDLRDIYLVHTERQKQRDGRLRAYKETIRELVADGLVSRAELVILDNLRAQLGISDKDHQKIVGELSEEERQLFDPSYQGSVEQRLQRQQYQRDLERLVVDAARGGAAPSPAAIDALRRERGTSDDEHAATMATLLAEDGPVAALCRESIAAAAALARAAAAAHDPADLDSASLALVRSLAERGVRAQLARALGIAAVMRKDPAAMALRGKVLAARTVGPDLLIGVDAAAVPALPAMQAALAPLAPQAAPAPLDPAPLLAVLDLGGVHLRAALAQVLSRFDDGDARGRLEGLLGDAEPIVREAAVRALGARNRLTRDLLSRALADADGRVRSAAVRAVSGGTSGELPAIDVSRMAQTTRGVGNQGAYATLDANAVLGAMTTIERMMLLRQVPMFAPLDPEDLEELAGVVEERRFDPGMDLCREGDAGDAVFLIVRGHVRVFTGGRGGRSGNHERTLSTLGEGACIGEMAVFDHAPRSATVRAEDRVRALVVPGEGFLALLADRPEMNQAIITELVRRMRGLMAASAATPPPSEPDPATTLPR